MADNKDLFDYNEESIKSLDWKEHIRLRPGMYIGKLATAAALMTAYMFY
jgi:topoisomerase-4 subunit B